MKVKDEEGYLQKNSTLNFEKLMNLSKDKIIYLFFERRKKKQIYELFHVNVL